MTWSKSPNNTTDGTMHSFVFTPSELRQILGAYTEGVLKKNWKDYGIQATKKETLFAVIDRSENITNTAIICALKKTRAAKASQQAQFSVYDGERVALKTASFLEALEFFRKLHPKSSSKGPRKSDHLKLIS